MRLRFVLPLVGFSLCGIALAAVAESRSLYLLADDNGAWCGYRSEDVWNAEMKSRGNVPVAAKVEYVNEHVTTVAVTTNDESGDWTTYDKYTLSAGEQISGLERTIVIPEGLKQVQSWSIGNGHAAHEKTTNRNVATNAIVSDPGMPIPDTEEIVTRAQSFPFWPLVHARLSEIMAKGQVCLAAPK